MYCSILVRMVWIKSERSYCIEISDDTGRCGIMSRWDEWGRYTIWIVVRTIVPIVSNVSINGISNYVVLMDDTMSVFVCTSLLPKIPTMSMVVVVAK